ncbi:MAG TPA: cytochrome c oxidase subunit II [bacterium]|nr:cytochrome c oxidase subunit II [bacterium]
MPGGATLQAADIQHVWNVFLLAAIGVAGVVYVLIFWCILRYRRRGDGLPPQFRHHTGVETVCTALAVLIVAGLFALSYASEVRIERLDPRPAATVRVTGFDWSWRFEYAGGGPTVTGTPDHPPVLVVPVGRPVHIDITSADVDHAFFVPAFLFKRDAIPGLASAFDLVVTRPGVYRGECAEFCGLDHAAMNFTVSAVTPRAYDQWLRERRTAGRPQGRPASAPGREDGRVASP